MNLSALMVAETVTNLDNCMQQRLHEVRSDSIRILILETDYVVTLTVIIACATVPWDILFLIMYPIVCGHRYSIAPSANYTYI